MCQRPRATGAGRLASVLRTKCAACVVRARKVRPPRPPRAAAWLASSLQRVDAMTHHRAHRVPTVLAALATVALTTAAWAQPKAAAREEFRIDVKKSRFLVETQTSGLSAMFSHDHKLEFTDYAGTASLTPGALSTGALSIVVKAASLRLIEEKSVGERQSVEAVLREDVLETAKYPEITFKTKKATATRRGDGTYDVRLLGELALHGVRRQVTIPARVSIQGDTLHAIGVFEVRQSDYDITPFSFVSGTVAVKDLLTIAFDLVATKG
jgi:polyisoprenoid-binding protein YceI